MLSQSKDTDSNRSAARKTTGLVPLQFADPVRCATLPSAVMIALGSKGLVI
jgi:hypothetical protein